MALVWVHMQVAKEMSHMAKDVSNKVKQHCFSLFEPSRFRRPHSAVPRGSLLSCALRAIQLIMHVWALYPRS